MPWQSCHGLFNICAGSLYQNQSFGSFGALIVAVAQLTEQSKGHGFNSHWTHNLPFKQSIGYMHKWKCTNIDHCQRSLCWLTNVLQPNISLPKSTKHGKEYWSKLVFQQGKQHQFFQRGVSIFLMYQKSHHNLEAYWPFKACNYREVRMNRTSLVRQSADN